MRQDKGKNAMPDTHSTPEGITWYYILIAGLLSGVFDDPSSAYKLFLLGKYDHLATRKDNSFRCEDAVRIV